MREDERTLPPKTSVAGQAVPTPAPRRELGFPPEILEPLYLFQSDKELKQHKRYAEAKAGNEDAAIQLIVDLALPLCNQLAECIDNGKVPKDFIVVAPHAREASGDNAIPQVIAAMLTLIGGELDEDIVQTTKVYHTGADPMERLNARPSFHGKIVRGANYVLVDDVTTLGGTLCDLSDFIRRGGGNPVAAIVLVNASRSGKLYPLQKTVALLEERFGNDIREIFNIEPGALTCDEAQYLIGFRSAEEIRSRSAQAREKTDLRLRAKGIRLDERERPQPLKRPHKKFWIHRTGYRVGRGRKK